MKKLNVAICMAAIALFVSAAERHEWHDSVTGYTWLYSIDGDEASIVGPASIHLSAPSILPKAKGMVAVPSILGGMPVTSIGWKAFWNCSGLTSVTIPDGVTSIGYAAFSGCNGLTSVTIPNSVTSIGDYAFSACSGLTSVTIPNSVTNIGSGAFSGCNGLTSVTIPDSVTSIGSYAFSGCNGLTSVTIPDSVTSIESYAFDGCTNMVDITIGSGFLKSYSNEYFLEVIRYCKDRRSITVSNDNPAYRSENGLLLTKDSKTLILGVNGIVVIPNGVTSITPYAFYGCNSLISVIIPDSVIDIGSHVFDHCCRLNTITVSSDNPAYKSENGLLLTKDGKTLIRGVNGVVKIPNGVTSIESYAFYGCSGLTSVTIPDSVTSIGSSAFYGCSGLTSVTIPDSVTSIGSSAFYGCGSLTKIKIGRGAVTIGDNAFRNCNLDTITISDDNPAYKTENGLLLTKDGKTLIRGVNGIVAVPNGVESIKPYAFSGCSALTDIIVPDSVTSIGEAVFSGCGSLSNMTLPFVGSKRNIRDVAEAVIGYLFGSEPYVGGVETTQLYYLTSRGDAAYNKYLSCCLPLSLKSVKITDGTYIARGAFSNCRGLTSVTIPDSVTRIWPAFTGCISLMDISVDGGNANYSSANGLLLSKDGKTLIEGVNGDVVIPDSVTNFNAAFYGCSGLTSVTIPDSVTSIGDSAFYGCSGLTSVTIPNSVTNIGSGAFSGCSGLTSVTIGNGVKSINGFMFSDCISLMDISVDGGNANYSSANGLLLSKDGKTLIKGVNGDVVIPDSVTSIGSGAFYGCSDLTSVTIPDSVTSIDSSAFYGCSDLTSVTIPDSVTSIDSSAFSGCRGLTSVTIGNGVKSINGSMFSDCISLMDISVDGGNANYSSANGLLLSKDGKTLIKGVNGDVVIPDSVTSIGGGAFYGCSDLTSVTIPDSVTYIGESAFRDCSGLKGVTIPDSVTYIRESAFRDCSGLTSVTIGEGVSVILSDTFSGCNALNCLRFCGDAPILGTSKIYAYDVYGRHGLARYIICTFYDVSPSCKVFVKRNSTGWGVEVPGIWEGLHIEFCDHVVSASIKNARAATCTESGYTGDKVCDICDEVLEPGSEIPALGHLMGEGVITKAPTIFEEGVTTYSCTRCGTLMKTEPIAKLVCTHDGTTSTKNARAATCTESGYTGDKVCDICDEVLESGLEIPALGHLMGEGVVTKEPTTTEEGEMTFYCTRCKVVMKTEPIAKLVDGPTFAISDGVLSTVKLNGATEVVIPDGVVTIDSMVFFGCTELTRVTIPRSVTWIGYGAFMGCTSLNHVTIPGSVIMVKTQAFCGCSSLTDVTIEDGVGYLEWGAFADCNDALYDRTTVPGVSLVDGWAVEEDWDPDRAASITGHLDLSPVRGISESCFNACTNITGVTIGDGAKSIGWGAFDGCDEAIFDTITIPGVRLVDGWVVDYDESLSGHLDLSTARGVGVNALWDSDVESVRIGKDTQVNPFALASRNLKSIDVDADNRYCKSVNGMLFSKDGKTLLQGVCGDVTVPSGVTSIGPCAFEDITMTSITFNGNAPTVGAWAFGEFWGNVDRPLAIVSRNSTGWGVEEGELWHGLVLRYANEHLVTFDVNGGGAVLADKTRTVKHGEPVGDLPTPARSGYAFSGWYTAGTGGTKISKSTKVMSDTKFYAHWDQTYTITLELEGGKCDSSTVFAVKSGGSLPDRVVTRYGHAFQGFFTEPNGGGVQYYGSDGKGVKAWDRTEGATLYASWASDGKFTVVLHKNDGTGLEHAVSVESGKDAFLPGGSDAVSKNGLAWAPRRGFSFMGWSLGEKDKTVAFADKANMKSSFTAGGMLDLYAVWQLDTASAYAIQYIRNDGSGSVRTVGFKCGVETNLNSANGLGFLRRGFDFLGWTLTTDDAKAVSAGSKEPWRQDMGTVAETTASKLLKVYASWRLKEGYYAIKFYKNDVENPFTGKWRELGYEYGKNTTLPTVKVGFGWEREGYTFVGWATSKDNAKAGKIWRGDAGVTTIPVDPGKTLTLFAVWAKDSASAVSAPAVCTGNGCASVGTAASEGKTVQTLVYFADGDSQTVEARIESDGFTVVELDGSAYCGYVSDGVGELLGPDGSILLVVIAVE